MIIKPRTRGFICTTAHPGGCAQHVEQQMKYVQSQPAFQGPRNALIIGASTGYGLASRIVAAFGAQANTIGVYRASEATDKRTASAGWYNSAAFEQLAGESGLHSYSVTGDAFTEETKERTVSLIKEKIGKIDLVIYSVATARRVDSVSGELAQSVLKPIGQAYTNKTVNFHTGEVSEITIEPATEDEIIQTTAVMGGDDWERWMNALKDADVLTDRVKTVAFSYIGPELTTAIYREGTIGRAKDHLEATAHQMNEQWGEGVEAYVTVAKALVTQSSSAIPVVPLYISLLYKIMKDKGLHEDCIEQAYRMFANFLYHPDGVSVDEAGRIRIDDWEMREDVQAAVSEAWPEIATETMEEYTDLAGYRQAFFQLFGFEWDGVDYEQDIDPRVEIYLPKD